MTAAAINSSLSLDEHEYRRRIWAWTMYDWANSAFATTILAAVLPVYFSQVAGATLPSATIATAYWSTGLSVSLLLIAVLSPILGTISDVMRGKKRFLAVFAGIGIVSTALLVLVSTGDWILASIFGIIGRIGFSGAEYLTTPLLPHVARKKTGMLRAQLCHGIPGRRHFAAAINIVMIRFCQVPRALALLSSVAVWWAVFTIPLRVSLSLRSDRHPCAEGMKIITTSFTRLRDPHQGYPSIPSYSSTCCRFLSTMTGLARSSV
jgi:UMF1 family MFS transporter